MALKPAMTNLSEETLEKIELYRNRTPESVASYIRRAVMTQVRRDEENEG